MEHGRNRNIATTNAAWLRAQVILGGSNMSNSPLVFISHSEADTQRLGQALAAELPLRATVALNGTLGAGKTRLVQALAAASGVDRHSVVSPTFVLVQEYHGVRTIYHIDAYRVRDDDEFLALGVDEYFYEDAVVLIEWAERVENCLPVERLTIDIEVTGPDERRFVLSAVGSELQATLVDLAVRCARDEG